MELFWQAGETRLKLGGEKRRRRVSKGASVDEREGRLMPTKLGGYLCTLTTWFVLIIVLCHLSRQQTILKETAAAG